MEKSRKQLLEKEIKMYEAMIENVNQMIEEAYTQVEIARLKWQKEQYKDYIRMDKMEIMKLQREDEESYLSGLDKLKAVQWYLEEEKGILVSAGGFQIIGVEIDEDDDVVIRIGEGGRVVVDIHDLYEQMKKVRRETKARELVDQILTNVDKLFKLVDAEEITQIRDTIYEAF